MRLKSYEWSCNCSFSLCIALSNRTQHLWVSILSAEILNIRQLGLQPWRDVSEAMHQFTDHRTAETPDELWLVEHKPIFTQGQAGKAEHLLNTGEIPVVQSDRGGQVTYHAPGQQILYCLIDIKRRKIGVRQLVSVLEQTVITTLQHYHIAAHARADAPGVYVAGKKICSLGLRIRRGCSFHGLALNIKMDLSPFQRINPCGYAGLQMTQLSEFCHDIADSQIGQLLVESFTSLLPYSTVRWLEANALP